MPGNDAGARHPRSGGPSVRRGARCGGATGPDSTTRTAAPGPASQGCPRDGHRRSVQSAVTPGPELHGLRVRLRQAHPIALDVAFECGAGELLALVGPSGSGKTTVLRCIAGLATPRDGEVTCDGETWLDVRGGAAASPQQRRVGLVFQHYALFPHLDALANVATAMSHQPREERAGRARTLLARVNMEGLESRRPSELSGGQRQRVALARALARDPRALLLDEPFSAVDQLTRRRLRLELAQLRREIRIPMVLVTHDLDEAQLLGDRLSVLHHGRTLQTGGVQKVMRQPASALVARLLDHRNVFTGVVSRHDAPNGKTWIDWAGTEIECALATRFVPGDRVDWVVPESHVVMHRRERPSRGERENPMRGVARDVVILGGDARVTLDVRGADTPLTFEVSAHVAARNRVESGAEVAVSLLADGIHLMPAAHADITLDRRVRSES